MANSAHISHMIKELCGFNGCFKWRYNVFNLSGDRSCKFMIIDSRLYATTLRRFLAIKIVVVEIQ